jgi:glyoxylase-like metal-dependent hydrolase (beta-lactamase superfamily II)
MPTMSPFLQAFADNPYLSNCWLLAGEGRDDAVVVDPGFSPERVRGLLAAAGKRPVAALATHGHSDHVGAAATFCGTELPLYIHVDDELALTDPVSWGAGYPSPAPGRPADTRAVKGGDVVEEAGFLFEVLHTPGHTPGSVCFRLDDRLFSGDLVFSGSVGRSDFPNSSAEAMLASLRRFLELPDELEVLPGHMETTTVGRERASNPFLLQLV